MDDTLFGPNRATNKPVCADTVETQDKRRSSAPGANGKTKSKKPEHIQVITKDLIRKLIVPRLDPSGESIVLPRSEFVRIKNASKVMSKEEREAQLQAIKDEKEYNESEAAMRKQVFAEEDLKRKKNEKLSDLEEEVRQQREHLLAKAQELRDEQTDEIKRLNELILNSKCHAIRDAQILEKDIIKKELTEEETRLDHMMEHERQRQIKLQEEYEEIKKQKKYEAAGVIRHQIAAREEASILEEEAKEQEARAMRRKQELMEEEDIQQLLARKVEQKVMAKELLESNELQKHAKEKAKEQDRALDLKVMEFLKEKAEREEAREQEIIAQKKEKEKEIARLRSLQEREQDRQAELDALKARRNQEAAEREWRRKEIEEAVKKKETEDMLKKSREEQLKYKELSMAVEVAKNEAEFNRVLRVQKEEIAKEAEKERMLQKQKNEFCQDIRAQIREKEQVKINERNQFFEEGTKLAEEARARREKIEQIKDKKIQELKEMGVPDKYLNEVIRKMNNPLPVGVR